MVTDGVSKDNNDEIYQFHTEDDSALLGFPDSQEIKIPIDADHSNMVKFNTRQDSGYSSALQYLRECESDALRVVASRFCALKPRP